MSFIFFSSFTSLFTALFSLFTSFSQFPFPSPQPSVNGILKHYIHYARDFSVNTWKWHQKAIHKFKIIGMWSYRRTISFNLSSHWYQFWLLGAAWINPSRVWGFVALPTQLLERKTISGFPRCWVTMPSTHVKEKTRGHRGEKVLLTSWADCRFCPIAHTWCRERSEMAYFCLFSFLFSALGNVANF